MGNVPGSQPSSLANPVPKNDEQDMLSELLNKYTIEPSAMPSEQITASGEPIDQLLEKYTAQEALPEQEAVTTLQDERPLVEQLQEAPTRAKASFAQTTEEKKNVLAKAYGPENVRLDNKENFEIRKNGKWRKFDSENFELIGDIADITAPVVEGALATAGTIGAIAGTGGVGLAGTSAIGAGASVAANELTNMFANHVLGIEQDPQRQRSAELMVAGAAGAVAEPLAKGLSLGLKEMAKRLEKAPITQAAKEASESAIRASETFYNKIQDLVGRDLLKPVTKEGVTVSPHQLNPKDMSLLLEQNDLMKAPAIQEFFQAQGQIIENGWQKIASDIGNLTPKSKVGETPNILQLMKDAEGNIIGQFRKEAIKTVEASGKENLNVAGVVQPIRDVMSDMGWKFGKTRTMPTATELVEKGFAVNEPQAKALISNLGKLEQKIYENGNTMSIKDLQLSIENMQRQQQNYYSMAQKGNASWNQYMALKKVTNILKEEELNLYEQFLPEGSRDAYQIAKGKYSNISNAMDNFANLFKNDELSASAFAKKLFSGDATLERIKTIKPIIEAYDPSMWKDVVGQYMSDVTAKNTSAKGVINFRGIKQDISKLGTEVVDEIAGKTYGAKTVKQFLDVAERLQATSMNPQASDEVIENALKGAFAAAKKSATSAGYLAKMFNALNFRQNAKVQRYLSPERVEQVMKNASPEEKQLFRDTTMYMHKLVEKARENQLPVGISVMARPKVGGENDLRGQGY